MWRHVTEEQGLILSRNIVAIYCRWYRNACDGLSASQNRTGRPVKWYSSENVNTPQNTVFDVDWFAVAKKWCGRIFVTFADTQAATNTTQSALSVGARRMCLGRAVSVHSRVARPGSLVVCEYTHWCILLYITRGHTSYTSLWFKIHRVFKPQQSIQMIFIFRVGGVSRAREQYSAWNIPRVENTCLFTARTRITFTGNRTPLPGYMPVVRYRRMVDHSNTTTDKSTTTCQKT